MASPNPMTPAARVEQETGFTAILQALLDSLPEALCVVFVDPEGETVDWAARIDPFEARIAGAELTIVVAVARAGTARGGIGQALELRVECGKKSILVRTVSDGYDLVVILKSSTISMQAAEKTHLCAIALLREAGLPPPPSFARLRVGDAHRSNPPGGSGSTKSTGAPALRPSMLSTLAEPMMVLDGKHAKIVAEVVGMTPNPNNPQLLVRLEDGEEALIAFDPVEKRWKRSV
jgi:hypothetical protein